MAAGTRKSRTSSSLSELSEGESHGDDARKLGPPSGSLDSTASTPELLHRIKHAQSILALAVAKQHVYAGTQSGEILKWSLETYTLVGQVAAHKGSLLCLYLSEDEKLLCSSASGGIVRISSTRTLEPLYSIYSTYDVGDVFTLVYSSLLQTVYLGAQNTSIQWYDLKEKDNRPKANPKSHPDVRNRRFFSSKAAGETKSPKQSELDEESEGQLLEIHSQHIVQYAHNGYVHCMILARGGIGGKFSEDEILLSGGGDGTIKLWNLDGDQSGAISEKCVLDNKGFSVLSMVLDDTFLYAGLLEGVINVWDLDTQQLVRSIKAESNDIWSVSISSDCILGASAGGVVKKFNHRYQCIVEWQAHQGMILASAVYHFKGRQIYITGGNDGHILIWNLDAVKLETVREANSPGEMLDSLAKFVSYRSISSERYDHAEGCRRGATFLRTLLQHFGADTKLLSTESNLNPVVLARFLGRSKRSSRKRILFYGHYDVVGATDGKDKWRTDPFRLEGINGFLYGRGVSDNKGPIIAAIYAAAELIAEQKLDADVIFLIEGEEECGSRGLEAAVKDNKSLIGNIDWILVANSYWIDDDVPCLTYGLRGVIHATVSVESTFPDLHSGIDGSTLIDEPVQDLLTVLGKLKGLRGQVEIPHFYEDVPGVTKAERERYTAITETLMLRNTTLKDANLLSESLIKRWQEPTLTIHRIKVSGPQNAAIIPHLARAAISIRLVPNQDVTKIRDQLVKFLQSEFKKLDSLNKIAISINQQAEPWLGDPDNAIFQMLEEAIIDVWGLAKGQPKALPQRHTTKTSAPPKTSQTKSIPPTSYTLTHGANHAQSILDSTNSQGKTLTTSRSHARRPLYIREGGSIGGIRFLEKEFDAPAAHLPCGQASDKAHLDNERLRLVNLYNSKEIFKRVFGNLP